MFKPQAIDLISASRSNHKMFLKAIFDGLNYDGFRFPTSGNDGCIENACISKALPVVIPGSAKRIAFHLNFMCTPGGYDGQKVNFNIKHFHLTARPLSNQNLINFAGPSILTAAESIHINRNGLWGRDDHIDAMAQRLDMERAELLTFLTTREGYTTQYMASAVGGMKRAIQHTVGVNAGSTIITWTGSDVTFL